MIAKFFSKHWKWMVAILALAGAIYGYRRHKKNQAAKAAAVAAAAAAAAAKSNPVVDATKPEKASEQMSVDQAMYYANR